MTCPLLRDASRTAKTFGYRVVRDGGGASALFPKGQQFMSGKDIAEVVVPLAAIEPSEVFWILPLNVRHRLIGGPIAISRGVVDGTLVHAREVFLAAIIRHAHCIVLAHNHPSGDPTPSFEDRQLTAQLMSAGKLLGIEVVDHVIVAGAQHYSMAEGGLL